MELLVLGGTSFAGRHVVEQAMAAGHAVTTFTRGRTNPGLFPEVRSLHGDRTSGDYAALEGAGPFDAVVDMCAYVPRAVREALGALDPDGLNGPYILISSVSAYAEPQANGEAQSGFAEDSPLATRPEGIDPASEDVTAETYGPLKVLTEQAAGALLPGGVMIIRPGLIVGPHDPTGRRRGTPQPLDRSRRGRHCGLGPDPSPGTVAGGDEPGARGGAAQEVLCGGPAARAMSQPRARSARG
jgi:nucleoside-diphosphate-sugar epimerase